MTGMKLLMNYDTNIFKYNMIGLTGYAYAGKDTAYTGVFKPLEESGMCFRVGFADALKAGLLAIDPLVPMGQDFHSVHIRLSALIRRVGWDQAKKKDEVRSLLQRFGTEFGRNIIDPDFWVDQALKTAKALHFGECSFSEERKTVVFTDVRYPNEARMIKKHGGFLICINREFCGPVNSHTSDAGLVREMVAAHVENVDNNLARLYNDIAELCVHGGAEKWKSMMKSLSS